MRTLINYMCVMTLSVAFLTACGWGGGGGEDSSKSGNSAAVASAIVKKGRFLDSAVQGIAYVSGGQSGLTDAKGTFKYEEGASVTFRVGKITLGQGEAFPIMTPVNLVAGATKVSHPTVSNLTRFLQTLDQDGNPDNGITISNEVRSVATTAVDFTLPPAQFENKVQTVVQTLTALNQTGPRPLVSATEAQTHLDATISATPGLINVDAPLIRLTLKHMKSKDFVVNVPEGQSYTLILRNVNGGSICLNSETNCTFKTITRKVTGRKVFSIYARGADVDLEMCVTSEGRSCGPSQTIKVDTLPTRLTLKSWHSKDFVVNAPEGQSYTIIARLMNGGSICLDGETNCTSLTSLTLTRKAAGRKVFSIYAIFGNVELEVCVRSEGRNCWQTIKGNDDKVDAPKVDAPPIRLTLKRLETKNFVVNAPRGQSYTIIIRSLEGGGLCLNSETNCISTVRTFTLKATGRKFFSIYTGSGLKLEICTNSEGTRCWLCP